MFTMSLKKTDLVTCHRAGPPRVVDRFQCRCVPPPAGSGPQNSGETEPKTWTTCWNPQTAVESFLCAETFNFFDSFETGQTRQVFCLRTFKMFQS